MIRTRPGRVIGHEAHPSPALPPNHARAVGCEGVIGIQQSDQHIDVEQRALQ
jgi:hypothetical protein